MTRGEVRSATLAWTGAEDKALQGCNLSADSESQQVSLNSCAENYSVFKKAISDFFSGSASFSPNSCPLTALVFTP